MSEKQPNMDQEKRIPDEHFDNASKQEFQKLQQKIDKLIEQMSENTNDKHPYEDYKSFEASTRMPSYFKDLVSIFEVLKTRENGTNHTTSSVTSFLRTTKTVGFRLRIPIFITKRIKNS